MSQYETHIDPDDDDEDLPARRKAASFLTQHGVEANVYGYFSVPHWIDEQTCSRRVFDSAIDAADFLKSAMFKRGELAQFRVSLRETPSHRSCLDFECVATDADDAIEQAEAAYPGCVILQTAPLESSSPASSSTDR